MHFFEISSLSRQWHDFNLNNLNTDEAYLNLTSLFFNTVRVYSLSSDCVQCPFSYVTSLNRTSQTVSVSTKHYSVWRFYDETFRTDDDGTYKAVNDNKNLVCEIKENFGEFGIYDLIVGDKYCECSVRKEPVNIYSSLLLVTVGLLIFYACANLFAKFRTKEVVVDESSNTNAKSSRTRSIDTFRGLLEHSFSFAYIFFKRKFVLGGFVAHSNGLALCSMIFVNDGGGQYWFFNHCTWNGLYPADVLFPWFLWIMGLCIPLSQKTLSKDSHYVYTLVKNILRRSVTLFLFGLGLNTLGVGPIDLTEIRVPGVLQRIAISYAVVSLISVLTRKLQMKYVEEYFDSVKTKDVAKRVHLHCKRHCIVCVQKVKLCPSFNYWTVLIPQWLIHLCILYIHYELTFHLSVPGCPRGYLGPGGMQDNNLYANCTGGATGYIDRVLLGEKHLYQHAAVRRVYRSPVVFDPENILGCLTSIFQTFLGTLAGYVLCQQTSPSTSKIRHLLIWCVVTLSFGLILHYSDAIPLNKNLWSLSFVLTTSGLAFFVFAIIYYLVDHAHLWNGSPFIYPGMNSVLVYVGHEICFQMFPWHWKITPMNTHFLHLVENTWGVILWIAITRKLFEKRVFLNV